MSHHIVDNKKHHEALRLQRQAAWAFDMADFEIALELYSAAEKLFRLAFATPGDRVFFMQASALRCLEELTDAGVVDMIPERQKSAEAFFEEWTPNAIKRRISRERSSEATAFLAWRRSNIDAQHEFDRATAAVTAGNYDEARRILEEAIRTAPIDDTECDALIAIASCKIEMLSVQEEMAKPDRWRDMEKMADAYQRAANASRLPTGSSSNQGPRIVGFHHWWLSYAAKFRAFGLLRDESVKENPEEVLAKALGYLNTACREVEHAVAQGTQGQFPGSHLQYLRYWRAITKERLSFLIYMRSGVSTAITDARRSCEHALDIANTIPEEKLFPNRFYSRRDLELEGSFLRAAQAFRERNWEKCNLHLEHWLENFPVEYKWSWRFTQVSIRLFLTRALLAHQQRDPLALTAAISDADAIGREELIGNVGRMLLAQVKTLWLMKDLPLAEDYVDRLCACFPPESVMESLGEESQFDFLRSLPDRVRNWLEQARKPVGEWELEESKARVTGAVEALLVYTHDYYCQIIEPSTGVADSVDDLFKGGVEIIPSGSCKDDSSRLAIDKLKKAAIRLREADNTETYQTEYARLLSAIRSAIKFMPVIVHLADSSELEGAAGRNRIVGQFDWSRHEGAPKRDLVWLEPAASFTAPLETVYLPPEWRKGNRTYYRESGRTPIIAASRAVNWKKWESEAANASWLKLEGVSWDLLEKAIELADQSRPESSEAVKPRPKVGAIIVKDGQVLSEAWRNQDGEGGHAEELALSNIKPNERERLIGAIAITTLEPCITGRSPEKMECAILLLKSGIKKVVIGMLDPNRQILGVGYRTLADNGVEIAFFPSVLHARIWEMNRDFAEAHIEHDVRSFRLPWRMGISESDE